MKVFAKLGQKLWDAQIQNTRLSWPCQKSAPTDEVKSFLSPSVNAVCSASDILAYMISGLLLPTAAGFSQLGHS